MASITKRGKTYQYTISRYIDGEYKPIRKGGFTTKAEAKTAAALIEGDIAQGNSPLPQKTLFPEYFRQWIDDYKSAKARDTIIRYKTSANTVDLAFEGIYMQDITKRQYQRFMDEYGQTRERATLVKINSHIRACVKDAIDEGLLRVDFTRGVQFHPQVKSGSKAEKYLNYEESKKLYQYAISRIDYSYNYMMIALALVTGLRFGEILAIRKPDCDFKNNTIHIWQSFDYKHNLGFKPLKNNADGAERLIHVDGKTMKILSDFISRQPLNIDKRIFNHPYTKTGIGLNKRVNELLKKSCKQLGITEITFHGLRHTHISILLFKGNSIQYVSERAGHSDINTTLKTYAHILKEMKKEEEKKAVEALMELTS